MNVRVFFSVALLIGVPFGRPMMAEESSILSRATEAWRKGDTGTALKLIEPALTVIEGGSR